MRYSENRPVKDIAKLLKKDQRYISTRLSRIKRKYKIRDAAVVDRDDLGITAYFLFLVKIDPLKRKELLAFARNAPCVFQIWGSDEWNGILYAGVKKVSEFTNFRQNILDTFRKHILEHKTITLLREFRLAPLVLTEDNIKVFSTDNGKQRS
jgi:2'-5' RNA ligase